MVKLMELTLMIDAPISALFTGLLAGMLVMLSGPVSFRRIATRTSIGPGNDPLLQRLIRTQGNFVEYAPMGVFAMFLVEAGGASDKIVWTIGGLLFAGRLIHAFGMMIGITPARSVGMILTYASMVTSAVYLIAGSV
jgi:uncharacterized protein